MGRRNLVTLTLNKLFEARRHLVRRQWIGGMALAAIAATSVLLVMDFTSHSGKASHDSIPPPLTRGVDFSSEVTPILRLHCVRCHGPKSERGGLRLDTYAGLLAGGRSGPAVVPGHSESSILIRHVVGLDDRPIMPPPKSPPLNRDEIRILRTWVDRGAQP